MAIVPEQSEGKLTPQTGLVNIDIGYGEEDFIISAEQKAEAERAADRIGQATLAVDVLIPGKREDLAAPLFKQAFAEQLAKTEIPEADLQQYAASVYTAARDVSPPDRNLIYTLKTFINTSWSVEQAQLFAQFARLWKERFLATASDDRVRYNRANNFTQLIYEMSGAGRLPKPEPRSAQETTALFEAIAEVYDTAYALPETEENQRIFNALTNGARDLGLRTNDPDQIRKVLQIYKEVAGEPNKELVGKIMDTVVRYGRIHGLTEDAVHGFVEKLVPAMRSNDAQVAILTRGGNIWGMKPGDFGAGDFLVHSYALRITPAHINELLMAAREVPTTDLARLEQNRLDALTLAAPFGALRDFVHDQRPYVHEVIDAMVNYYDTADSKQLLSVLDKVDPGYLGSEGRRALLLDRNNYDIPTEERRAEGNPQNETVKPIDILRRLNENTKPAEDTIPVTTDETFNKLLKGLAQNGNQAALQQVLDYINSRLMVMMQRGEIGIEPNLILAFAFLDKKGFQVLQKLNYEDQLGAYKQGWFYSILRFQELTSSPLDYNEGEFHQFLSQVASAESAQAAYRLIAQREVVNVSKLARIYNDMGKGNKAGALWSGNIAHELIGLTDLRSPITEQGRKAVKETVLRVKEPGYHPGD